MEIEAIWRAKVAMVAEPTPAFLQVRYGSEGSFPKKNRYNTKSIKRLEIDGKIDMGVWSFSPSIAQPASVKNARVIRGME